MNQQKILLVEDELFLRELYGPALQKAGYLVLTAADGEAGLHLAQSNPDADLLLLDVMLPKMHGIEVLRQLKSSPSTKNLPVILLTNLTEQSVVEEALQLGAKGYFVKIRVSPKQLVEKVKEYMVSYG